MDVKLNVHNLIVVGLLAVLAILALRLLSKTGVANVPVLGQAVKVGGTA